MVLLDAQDSIETNPKEQRQRVSLLCSRDSQLLSREASSRIRGVASNYGKKPAG